MAKRLHKDRKPFVTVILVNFNVREFLHNSLTSLVRSLRGIPSEIIVVDNASTDDSLQMLRADFPSVQVIANEQNLGFSRANNQALLRARGDFFLLINPDTIVQENTVNSMLEFFDKHAEAGLAGCKILNSDGSFQLPCRRSFPSPWVAFTKIVRLSTLFPRSRWFGKYNLTYISEDTTHEVDAVSGSFMMLRRSVYEAVGGLDESFFMYGEDIDWCYRIQRAGWKIFYVHETSIIHYRGESTRRSSINEVKVFYDAMDLFVKKYFASPVLFHSLLRLGILLSGAAALLASGVRVLRFAWLDMVLVNVSLLLAEWIRRGEIFRYPAYAYPVVFVFPALIVVASLYALGAYTYRVFSLFRSVVGVIVAFVLIATLTAFFKDYAFSRAIILLSGVFSTVALPSWRLLVRVMGGSRASGIFSRRTLIVGTNGQASELIRRLHGKIAEGYHVIGCIGKGARQIGSTVGTKPVVGSIENLPHVVRELRVSDVIVAPGAATYRELLAAVSQTARMNVSFHIVPNSMEVIIGKASIDTLNDVPLVPVSYNIQKPLHRLSKRAVDLIFSALLLCTLYPILYALGMWRRDSSWRHSLPRVFWGSLSLVGPVAADAMVQEMYFGKPGITGLVQLKGSHLVSGEEREQLNLFYARNQSLLLDTEIFLKSLLTPI